MILNQPFRSGCKAITSFLLFVSLFLTLPGGAQKGNADQKAAMQKLRWMMGTWRGQSTVSADTIKRITNINETVQASLDGTILQITVRATDRDTNTNRQSLAYTSFSVISYDVKNKKYRWTSWRTSGRDYEEQPFTVGINSFEYTSEEDGRQIRYKATLSPKGEFLERGDYSKDGSSWTSFITMRLVRSK